MGASNTNKGIDKDIEQKNIQEENSEADQARPKEHDNLWYSEFGQEGAKKGDKTAKKEDKKDAPPWLAAVMKMTGAQEQKKPDPNMKPEDLQKLDQSSIQSEKYKKATDQEKKQENRQAFMQLNRSLQTTPKLPIASEGKDYVFEFKGVEQPGEGKESAKMMEKVDKGGDVPKNVEFHFTGTYKKDSGQSEDVLVDFRVSFEQIRAQGLVQTLTGMLSQNYAAASYYDARRMESVLDTKDDGKAKEKPAAAPEAHLDDMKKQLIDNGLNVSTIQTKTWEGIVVTAPRQEKQITVTTDGIGFEITEKNKGESIEKQYNSPQEVMAFIDQSMKT